MPSTVGVRSVDWTHARLAGGAGVEQRTVGGDRRQRRAAGDHELHEGHRAGVGDRGEQDRRVGCHLADGVEHRADAGVDGGDLQATLGRLEQPGLLRGHARGLRRGRLLGDRPGARRLAGGGHEGAVAVAHRPDVDDGERRAGQRLGHLLLQAHRAGGGVRVRAGHRAGRGGQRDRAAGADRHGGHAAPGSGCRRAGRGWRRRRRRRRPGGSPASRGRRRPRRPPGAGGRCRTAPWARRRRAGRPRGRASRPPGRSRSARTARPCWRSRPCWARPHMFGVAREERSSQRTPAVPMTTTGASGPAGTAAAGRGGAGGGLGCGCGCGVRPRRGGRGHRRQQRQEEGQHEGQGDDQGDDRGPAPLLLPASGAAHVRKPTCQVLDGPRRGRPHGTRLGRDSRSRRTPMHDDAGDVERAATAPAGPPRRTTARLRRRRAPAATATRPRPLRLPRARRARSPRRRCCR